MFITHPLCWDVFSGLRHLGIPNLNQCVFPNPQTKHGLKGCWVVISLSQPSYPNNQTPPEAQTWPPIVIIIHQSIIPVVSIQLFITGDLRAEQTESVLAAVAELEPLQPPTAKLKAAADGARYWTTGRRWLRRRSSRVTSTSRGCRR